MDTIYARIEGRRIIEYPVYELHIRNRHHPIDWYTPCLFDVVPETDAFHYVRESRAVSLDGRVVEVRYTIEPYTLDALLARLPRSPDEQSRMPPGMEQPELPPPTPELLERIKALIAIRVQENMDLFANTRGYDTIASACSYAASSNPRFSAEAAYCVKLRDDTWMCLYTKLAEVESGAISPPTRYSIIQSWLPVPAWPE